MKVGQRLTHPQQKYSFELAVKSSRVCAKVSEVQVGRNSKASQHSRGTKRVGGWTLRPQQRADLFSGLVENDSKLIHG